MKPIIDINFTADYNINDKVTVFLNLDNIAHARYQLYYDYPVTGIQAFAGLKVKF
jgi:outer membrane cobalamin receptor